MRTRAMNGSYAVASAAYLRGRRRPGFCAWTGGRAAASDERRFGHSQAIRLGVTTCGRDWTFSLFTIISDALFKGTLKRSIWLLVDIQYADEARCSKLYTD